MTKILFYTSVFQNVENGPSKFVNILKELNGKQDIEIQFLSEDISYENETCIKLNFKSYKYLFFLNFFLKNLLIFYKIRKLIKSNCYDVIWYNNTIDGLISSFLLKSVKHIGMINDDSSINASIKQYGFTYKYLRHKLFQSLERLSCLSQNIIVINSLYLKKLLLSRYKVNPEKVNLLYKSIDTRIYKSNCLSINTAKTIKILFVKTDFERGGLINLIGALNNLDYKFELTIIGPSTRLINTVLNHENIGTNILIKPLGNQTQDQVFDHLINHHIFCTPSYMEALGVANMEALIHKTPVVYSNVGGIPEVMDFGRNGFVAEPNVESLSNAIKLCIISYQSRNEKTSNGYNFVLENFSKDKMLKNFVKITLN